MRTLFLLFVLLAFVGVLLVFLVVSLSMGGLIVGKIALVGGMLFLLAMVIVPILLIMSPFIVLAAAHTKRGRRRNAEERDTHRIAQELNCDLERMAERIEALETILLDKFGKR